MNVVSGVNLKMCGGVGDLEDWFILKWQVIVCFGKGCLGSVGRGYGVMLIGWGILDL